MTAFFPTLEITESALPRWQRATWADYERQRDEVEQSGQSEKQQLRLFFDDGYLRIWVGRGLHIRK